MINTNLLFIPHPLYKLLNSRLLTIHQNTYPVNFSRHYRCEYKRTIEQHHREQFLPQWNTKWQTYHHYNGRGDRNE